MSCSFYSFGMPSSLFINHNPTEIITAYLCDYFIILENKKRAEALLPIQLNYLAIFAKYSRVRTSCEV